MTILALPGKPFALSTVRCNKKQFALSTVDPRIVDIERTRAAAKMSHIELCREARVHPSTWFYLRNGQQMPRKQTLDHLTGALEHRMNAGHSEAALIFALVRLAMQVFAQDAGEDVQLMLAQDFSAERGRDQTWVAAARLRQQAIYLVAVELQVSNAVIGRALGCSRAGILKARNAVEDMRSADRALDARLDAVAAVLRPRPAGAGDVWPELRA